MQAPAVLLFSENSKRLRRPGGTPFPPIRIRDGAGSLKGVVRAAGIKAATIFIVRY